MKMKTEIIFALLFITQISFGQNNQTIEIPNDTLGLEDDIEREPIQLSYKEIEDLYFEFRYFKNIPNGKSIFPNLKLYFEEMDKGLHPFEIFEDETFWDLHSDTSDLRVFVEEIKIEFDKEKIKNSNFSIKF